MTPIQLAALIALGAIGLGILITAAALVSGYAELRKERRRQKSLLERLESDNLSIRRSK